MNWRIETFGGLRLLQGERVLERFRTQKSALLLAYLASFPRRTYSREAVGEMLWPDEVPEKQRNRLRYELSTLRKLVGEDPFHAPDNSLIALLSSFVSDAAAFEEAARTAAKAGSPSEKLPYLEAAAALYKGDFLPGFYDNWSSAERDKLEQLHGDTLTQLFLSLDSLGLHDAARRVRADCIKHFPDRALPALRPAVSSGSTAQAVASDAARRFHGREAERETLRAFLANPSPLLTLTGMGGIGKTRLAQEAVRGAKGIGRAGGIPIIALANARDGDAVLQEIWNALPDDSDVPAPEIRPALLEKIVRFPTPVVMVLDNVEQIPDIAPTLAALLSDCANLQLIVTSQTPLGIEREQVLPLYPLPSVNALALFLDRARSVRPDFAASDTGRNGDVLRAICDLLEGIPLSIELAAARVSSLGANEVLRQLKDRLAFLASSEQTGREKRHSSLRAALSWTTDLLSARSKGRFGAVSVFAGGFDLSALEAVSDAPPAELLADLEELCRYGLFYPRFDSGNGAEGDESTRWECLEIVRDFAETLCPDRQRALLQAKHATYFADEGNRNAERSFGGEWRETHDWLLRERFNMENAIAFLVETRNTAELLKISGRYARLLFTNGFWEDCDRLLQTVEAVSPPSDADAVDILGLRGAMARRRGREADAERFWSERLVIQEKTNGGTATFDTLCDLAGQALDTKQWDKARVYLRRIDAVADIPAFRIYYYVLQARFYHEQGDGEQALRFVEQSFASPSSEKVSVDTTLYRDYYVASIFREQGGKERAFVVLQNALATAYEARNSFVTARFCAVLAELWEEDAVLEKAGIALYAAQKIHTTLGSRLAAKSVTQWLRFRQKATDDAALSVLLDNLSAFSWETATEMLLEEQTYG
ncbi:MAG: hypothetical protein H7Y38_15210 [Armatimonadetes bacterium]|nr:hypothetical protein [Armatimonadota bacterium]